LARTSFGTWSSQSVSWKVVLSSNVLFNHFISDQASETIDDDEDIPRREDEQELGTSGRVVRRLERVRDTGREVPEVAFFL
jgi:hypothetical protein